MDLRYGPADGGTGHLIDCSGRHLKGPDGPLEYQPNPLDHHG